jgi:hypothetical protein
MDRKETPQSDVDAAIRAYDARPITASLPRMGVAGALTITGFAVVVFGNRAGWLPGGIITLFILFAYLGLIEAIASRNNDGLEVQRWRRFRSGGILGLVLGAALGFAVLSDSGQPPLALSLVLAFLVLLPAVAGFAFGYLNLRLRDQGDKAKLAAKLRTGATTKPSPSGKGQDQPATAKLFATQDTAKMPPAAAGRPQDAQNLARSDEEVVGFYWFDSRAISEIAHGNYGRFIYDKILPLLAPAKQMRPKAWCVLYDGDCMTSVDTLRPHFRAEDGALLDGAAGLEENLCYVVAVLGQGITAPQALDQTLRLGHVPGYLGLTMLAPDKRSREALERCRLTMALSIAGRIDGATFRRISYGFHTDAELKAMGFKEIARKQ